MNQYLIDIDLPEELEEDFMALVPAQRLKINKLMGNRTISSYSLALDRSKLWVTINAKSGTEVMDVLSTFPLIKYMKFHIHELMFHHEASMLVIPPFSLN